MAGIVDGEGHFSAYSRSQARQADIRMRLIVSNTSPALMVWLYETYGGYIEINKSPGTTGHVRNKVLYRWMLGRQEAAAVVTEILPYMVVKKAEAAAWLQLSALIGTRGNGAERLALVSEIKSLKRAA